MEKIYEKADDQHVRSLVAYGKMTETEGDHVYEMYANPELTEYLDAKEVNDAFNKNMLSISFDSAILRPVSSVPDELPTPTAFSYIALTESDPIFWTVAVDPEA